jgi:hypothetical protein
MRPDNRVAATHQNVLQSHSSMAATGLAYGMIQTNGQPVVYPPPHNNNSGSAPTYHSLQTPYGIPNMPNGSIAGPRQSGSRQYCSYLTYLEQLDKKRGRLFEGFDDIVKRFREVHPRTRYEDGVRRSEIANIDLTG